MLVNSVHLLEACFHMTDNSPVNGIMFDFILRGSQQENSYLTENRLSCPHNTFVDGLCDRTYLNQNYYEKVPGYNIGSPIFKSMFPNETNVHPIWSHYIVNPNYQQHLYSVVDETNNRVILANGNGDIPNDSCIYLPLSQSPSDVQPANVRISANASTVGVPMSNPYILNILVPPSPPIFPPNMAPKPPPSPQSPPPSAPPYPPGMAPNPPPPFLPNMAPRPPPKFPPPPPPFPLYPSADWETDCTVVTSGDFTTYKDHRDPTTVINIQSVLYMLRWIAQLETPTIEVKQRLEYCADTNYKVGSSSIDIQDVLLHLRVLSRLENVRRTI